MVVTHRLILTLLTHRTPLRVGVVKLHWGPRVWTLSSQQQLALVQARLVSATQSFACSYVYPVGIFCMAAVSVEELRRICLTDG
jgi:hypothetical protein